MMLCSVTFVVLNFITRSMCAMSLASITVKCDSSAPCDLLGKFFKDVRKINGKEYEPSTLTGLQRRIQSFLSDSGSKMNILKDDEFAFSRKVLKPSVKTLLCKAKATVPTRLAR